MESSRRHAGTVLSDDDGGEDPDMDMVTAHSERLCDERKQGSQDGDKLLRTGPSKRNKPALCSRCLALNQGHSENYALRDVINIYPTSDSRLQLLIHARSLTAKKHRVAYISYPHPV